MPCRTADVHTVVLEQYRGMGAGTTLVKAAEEHAAKNGVSHLIAPILSRNAKAAHFYTAAGFDQHGLLLRKEITGTS